MVPGSIQPLEVGTCAPPAAEIHASRVVYSFAMFQRVKCYSSNTASLAIWSVLYRFITRCSYRCWSTACK